MADSAEFREGQRQGQAERLLWIWNVLTKSKNIHEAKDTVINEMRRMFPGLARKTQ